MILPAMILPSPGPLNTSKQRQQSLILHSAFWISPLFAPFSPCSHPFLVEALESERFFRVIREIRGKVPAKMSNSDVSPRHGAGQGTAPVTVPPEQEGQP
jgi:hypothetical protein